MYPLPPTVPGRRAGRRSLAPYSPAMTPVPNELLAETFVELADTMVADFDFVEFVSLLTTRCVDVLGVGAAGVLLADQPGQLRMVAASSEETRVLELFALQHAEGPCLECYRTGTAVVVPDLDDAARRWPRFADAVRSAGFAAVQALPMRLRADTIGALSLVHATAGSIDAGSTRIAQAMAGVATIGLLRERAMREQEELAGQLQAALHSRVLIEQAKGIVAERLKIDMDAAFVTIRGYARQRNQLLSTVAQAVVEGSIDDASTQRSRTGDRPSAFRAADTVT